MPYIEIVMRPHTGWNAAPPEHVATLKVVEKHLLPELPALLMERAGDLDLPKRLTPADVQVEVRSAGLGVNLADMCIKLELEGVDPDRYERTSKPSRVIMEILSQWYEARGFTLPDDIRVSVQWVSAAHYRSQ